MTSKTIEWFQIANGKEPNLDGLLVEFGGYFGLEKGHLGGRNGLQNGKKDQLGSVPMSDKIFLAEILEIFALFINRMKKIPTKKHSF